MQYCQVLITLYYYFNGPVIFSIESYCKKITAICSLEYESCGIIICHFYISIIISKNVFFQ